MTLPEVAQELRLIANVVGIGRLHELADEIARRKSKKGPVTSNKCDRSMRDKIRAFRIRHPEMSQSNIAKHFNVNSGRVSEALHGKRK